MAKRKPASNQRGGDSGSDDEPIGDTPTELRRIRDELQRVKTSRRRDRIVGAALFVLAAAFITDNRLTAREIKRSDQAGQERTRLSLVGICAVGNVDRINERNRLADVAQSKPYVLTDAFPAYLDRQLQTFGDVDCKGLVPARDRVNICLQYPSTNDPKTGKPIPTTTTPTDKTACENAGAG